MAIFGTPGTTRGIWGRPRLTLSNLGSTGGNRSTPSLTSNSSGKNIPYVFLTNKLPTNEDCVKFSEWVGRSGHQKDIICAVIEILDIFDAYETKLAATNAHNYIIENIENWKQWPAIMEGVRIFNLQAHAALKDKLFYAWHKKQHNEKLKTDIIRILKLFENNPRIGGINAIDDLPTDDQNKRVLILEGLRILDPVAYQSLLKFIVNYRSLGIINYGIPINALKKRDLSFSAEFKSWLDKIDQSYLIDVNTIIEILIEYDTKKAIENIYNILQEFRRGKQNTLKKGIGILDPESYIALTNLESFKKWQQNQNPSDRNFLKGKVNAIIKEFRNSEIGDATADAFGHLKGLKKEKRDSILEGVKIQYLGVYYALSELFKHIDSLLEWYKKEISGKNIDESIIKEIRKKYNHFGFTFFGRERLKHSILEELKRINPVLEQILRTGEIKTEEPPKAKPQKPMFSPKPSKEQIKNIREEVRQSLVLFGASKEMVDILFPVPEEGKDIPEGKKDLIKHIAIKRKNFIAPYEFASKLEGMARIMNKVLKNNHGNEAQAAQRFANKGFWEFWGR